MHTFQESANFFAFIPMYLKILDAMLMIIKKSTLS